MVKNTNTRITITISKKQYKWLNELCEEKGMKMSKLISWLLYQKTIDVVNTKNLLENPDQEFSRREEISEEEFQRIMSEINQMIEDGKNKPWN